MKKHLLTTTAALAMVGGAASAQEWDVTVGGFFTGNLTFSEASGSLVAAGEDFDGLQTHINTEVHFKPSITLDNGMTFGAHIELEGNTSGDQIDETYMYVESDTLGRIEFGSENSAGYKSMVGAPGVGGLPINSGSQSAFLPVEVNAADVLATAAGDSGLTYTADVTTDADLLPESVTGVAELFGGELDTDTFDSLTGTADQGGASGIVDGLVAPDINVFTGFADPDEFNVGEAFLLGNGGTFAEGGSATVAVGGETATADASGTITVSGTGVSAADLNDVEINYLNVDGVMVDPGRFRDAFGSSFTETSGNNDANRISYYTPSLNGLTIGVSYAADASQGNALEDRNDNVSDFFDIGANYSQSFGAMDISLAARYGTADATGSTTVFDLDNNGNLQNTDTAGTALEGDAFDTTDVANGDPETWAVGFQLGYDAFTVGASYAENESGIANNAGDSEGYSVGVTYNTGVWTLGGEMISGEAKMGDVLSTDVTLAGQAGGNSVSSTAETNRVGVDAEQMTYKFGATRSLGAGVSWSVYGIYTEQKAKAGGATIADVDATAIGTAISLNF